MFNICLGDSRALEPQRVSRFIGVKMRRYRCKNAALLRIYCFFALYQKMRYY